MNRFDRNVIREQVLSHMECGIAASDEAVYREIDRVILKESHTCCGTLREKEELREQVFNAIRRLDLLEPYLQDDSVTEIMVVGASRVFVERNGVIEKTEENFSSEKQVYRLIDQMIAHTNRVVNEASPIVDSRLADGSRVHIVIPPVSLVGPVITIRKFQKGGMTMEKLVEYGEFPERLKEILACFVRGRYSILISGATNSGKSSLLNALAEYITPGERIITIEDSAELQFHNVENLVRLETRNANVEGTNAVTMNDLIRASLRMRPTRIVVGEVRGAEAVSMLQSLSTGHRGSFSSIHANSCRDALRRLEIMALMGMDMPLRAVQGLIGSSIDILIHLGRLPSGKRKLLEICEVIDFDGQEYVLNPLYRYDLSGEGSLRQIGNLKQVDRMREFNLYETFCEATAQWKRDEQEHPGNSAG